MAGWAVGIGWALLDALILAGVLKKGASSPEQAKSWIVKGFFARYFLAVEVLGFGLFFLHSQAVGVVVPLIIQKIVILAVSLFRK